MSRVRVVCLDDYQDVVRVLGPWNHLGDRVELVVSNEHVADSDQLVSLLAGAEVVVAMREQTTFDRALLERLPDLRLLLTKGMWNAAIDLDVAGEHGVVVSGTKNASSPTVEITWALILSLVRDLLGQDRAIREGDWQRGMGGELAGRTMGVIGLGNLGSKVARVGQAFGMDVAAWSQNPASRGRDRPRCPPRQQGGTVDDVRCRHLAPETQ